LPDSHLRQKISSGSVEIFIEHDVTTADWAACFYLVAPSRLWVTSVDANSQALSRPAGRLVAVLWALWTAADNSHLTSHQSSLQSIQDIADT
jgi:fructose-1,6-bisphosphatase/inositol monophosphatase family enzyme